MGFLGGWVFGLTSWIGTIYCYGIGAMLGVPAGITVGLIFSRRVSATDALFVFSVSVGVWVGMAYAITVPDGHLENTMWALLPAVVGAFVATLMFYARKSFPLQFKRWFGVVIGATLTGWAIGAFLGRIYS